MREESIKFRGGVKFYKKKNEKLRIICILDLCVFELLNNLEINEFNVGL